MPHAHAVCQCDHELKYCQVCDVTYCVKCKREWGIYRTWFPYYPQPTTAPYYSPYTISYDTNTLTLTGHQHS